MLGLIGLMGCTPAANDGPAPATPPVAVTPTTHPSSQEVVPPTTISPQPSAKAKSTPAISPSPATQLDIGGPYPIHAAVYPYSGSVLEPPDGDYRDAFLWTLRGLPGDGATDTTYIFGHTFAGPTPGVFDHLQNLSVGAGLRLTTATGTLHYTLEKLFPVDEPDADFRTDPRIWTVAPLKARGDYVVFIACLLNADGSLQTGKKIIAVFKQN